MRVVSLVGWGLETERVRPNRSSTRTQTAWGSHGSLATSRKASLPSWRRLALRERLHLSRREIAPGTASGAAWRSPRHCRARLPNRVLYLSRPLCVISPPAERRHDGRFARGADLSAQ